MVKPLPILITGAGAPGIRGTTYALRNNGEGRPVRLVGVDLRADAVGRHFLDAFHVVPPPEEPNYLDRLIEICRAEEIQIIIPQTTREIEVLSQMKGCLSRAGIVVMVSDAEAISVANNKARLLGCFEALGLPTAAHRLVRSESELVEAVEWLGYPGRPVVVKPPISSGMRGVRVLREEAWDVLRFMAEKPSGVDMPLGDLLAILRRGEFPGLLVTAYLPGPEYSVDAFMGRHVSLAVPRLRKAIRTGISFENILEFRADIVDQTLRAARHIGLQYAVGFQFKLDEQGVPMVLESNPRIQGTMVASLFGGANVIWMAVRELLGDPVLEMPLLRPASFHRFWGGVGLSEGECREI